MKSIDAKMDERRGKRLGWMLNRTDIVARHKYDNVLDVSEIKKICSKETAFEIGLKNAYNWYLSEKDTISFKEVVNENEGQILENLHYTK